MLLAGDDQGGNDNVNDNDDDAGSESSSDSESTAGGDEGVEDASMSASQNQAWNFFNQAAVAPSLDPTQEDVLEKLGLKLDDAEKKKKNKNITDHLAKFASNVDVIDI